MSVRLYLKLPKAELDKEILLKMFSDFQTPFTAKLIKERRKKECRGFGFVTVPTEEAAEEFISRYNQKPLIYNGEVYKDENGNDFLLVVERALPRKKKTKPQQTPASQTETEGGESPPTTEPTSTTDTGETVAPSTTTEKPTAAEEETKEKKAVDKPQRRKKKKSRKKSPAKIKAQKPASVSESVQPDPRWANELAKLKEMLAAQTSN